MEIAKKIAELADYGNSAPPVTPGGLSPVSDELHVSLPASSHLTISA
jgi:hypothetical protein